MKQFKALKVVVTGGAGFIGSHLVERLLALGTEVTVIDNFLHGSKIEHLGGHQSLSVQEGDIRDIRAVSHALQDKNVVFHLAACVGVEETQMSPSEVLDVEIRGTCNVLSVAANSGIERVIFGSSSEVYGDSPEPMKEEGHLSPKSTYAIAKLVGEEYCKAFHQKHGLAYTCLRYFNVYGPRQDERFVISRFVNRVLSHQPILIYGDGKQSRDFTYVDDAVNMSLLAGVKLDTICQTINIGTGAMSTINDVANIVANTLDNEKDVKTEYIHYNNSRPREVEVFTRCASTSRANNLLQYEPKIDLYSGIAEHINWYMERFHDKAG